MTTTLDPAALRALAAVDPAQLMEAAQSQLARRSLVYYYEHVAWPIIEPGRVFLPNWHIECIAEWMEAVIRGECQRLIINVPPRYGKTGLITIAAPTWSWIEQVNKRWLFVSYALDLSTEHSIKRRNLLLAAIYQRRWPHVQLSEDRNLKMEFSNTSQGHMIASSVGGVLTGRGGDIIVLDDPLSPTQAWSKADRTECNRFLDQTLSTRLDDKRKGAVVVVMQRLHTEDATGHLLSQGFQLLTLPEAA